MISQHSVSVLSDYPYTILLHKIRSINLHCGQLFTAFLWYKSCPHVTALLQSQMPKIRRSHYCGWWREACPRPCYTTKGMTLWENACFSPPSETDRLVDKADVVSQKKSGQASGLARSHGILFAGVAVTYACQTGLLRRVSKCHTVSPNSSYGSRVPWGP